MSPPVSRCRDPGAGQACRQRQRRWRLRRDRRSARDRRLANSRFETPDGRASPTRTGSASSAARARTLRRDYVSSPPSGSKLSRCSTSSPTAFRATLSDLRSRGKLTEADVDKAMREIRLALLEADVNFKVTKVVRRAASRSAIGAGVLESLDPGQMVVKVVNEQLAELMGGIGARARACASGPDRDPDGGAAGLGQDDRTREAGEARWQKDGKKAALAACDTQRPAAVEQLVRWAGAGRRHRLRAGHRARPGRHRRVGARPGSLRRASTC